MKALGMIEVYSFSTAVYVADLAAKTADVEIVALDRNRPIKEDVPAPLVMLVKMEGPVAAVQAAVEAGKAYAMSVGKYIVSHVIANPGTDVEKMAYLVDINKDKFNTKMKKVGGRYVSPKASEATEVRGYAIGLLEIQGLVASITALDAMVKTADVRLVHTEKRLGGRLVTLVVAGSISDVKAAIEKGRVDGGALGKVYGQEIIANPHIEVTKYFDMSVLEA